MALVLQGPILRNGIRDRVYPQNTTPVPVFHRFTPGKPKEEEVKKGQEMLGLVISRTVVCAMDLVQGRKCI